MARRKPCLMSLGRGWKRAGEKLAWDSKEGRGEGGRIRR